MDRATYRKEQDMPKTCMLHRTLLGFMARFNGEIPRVLVGSPCRGMRVRFPVNGGQFMTPAEDAPYDFCKECIEILQSYGKRLPSLSSCAEQGEDRDDIYGNTGVARNLSRTSSDCVKSNNYEFISRLLDQVGERKFVDLVVASGCTTRDSQNLIGALQYGSERFDNFADSDVVKKLGDLNVD